MGSKGLCLIVSNCHGPVFMLDSSTRIYSRSVILNLCKWFIRKFAIQCKTFCWWYVIIFSCSRCKHFCKILKWWLGKVNDWAFQWKISFNQDPSKQAQEVISVANQKDQPTHFKFWTVIMSLKPFLKTPGCHIRFQINI